MAVANRFHAAVHAYKEQILDAITALQRPHPFAAVTLACCALDLLAHSIHNPERDDIEDAYLKTVRRMDGYEDEGIPQQVYFLRCGLVHEFRTGDDVQHMSITAELDDVPAWDRDNGTLRISVPHFCRTVQLTFEEFFKDATPAEQRSFADRAFIYVEPIDQVHPQQPDMPRPSITNATNTFAPAASSTTPFPGNLRYR